MAACMRLLLAAALLRPCSAGGGPAWYKYEYEYNFFSDVLVIVFVFVALSFETFWHGLGESAETSYKYGKYHEQAANKGAGSADHNRCLTHPRLYKELYHRMGGEFMTLGVLAFLIFFINQLGGFDKLAKTMDPCNDDTCFHHPISDSDWLHLAEIVHVKLFCGMLLYYVLIYFMVRGSVRQIQQWEKLRLRRVQNRAPPSVKKSLRNSAAMTLDRDLEKHIMWSDYFIEHVLRMRRSRPETFEEVIKKCSIDSESPDVEKLLRECFDQRFSLSAYLSVNLEHAVEDSIEVHKPTWGVLLFLFGNFAALHFAAHVSLGKLVPFIITVSSVIFAVMWYLSKKSQSMIKNYIQKCRDRADATRVSVVSIDTEAGTTASQTELRSEPGEAKKKANIHERFNTETVLLRALQVFMFLISYVFSQTILDFEDWKVSPGMTALNTLCFTVLFLVLARFLPEMVPVFIAVMAFPPYVDEANLAAFFSVLYDDEEKKAEESSRAKREAAEAEERAGRSSRRSEVGPVDSEAINLEAVRQLAGLLGVSEELERRLGERGQVQPSRQQARV